MKTKLVPPNLPGLNCPQNSNRLAPAYPLVVHDPYFSIWSFTDKINEGPTKHWSGREHSLLGIIKVDGTDYLFLGAIPEEYYDTSIELASQTNVKISATQTIYSLECGGVKVDLTFTSPLLMCDLDIMARPVSYISVKTIPIDQRVHEVQVYIGATSAIAVNEEDQMLRGEIASTSRLALLKAGTVGQAVLEKKGDDLRIDWGYMFLAAPKEANVIQNITSATDAIRGFLLGTPSASVETGKKLMLNTIFPKETIAVEKEHLVLLGYDDIYSINYFGTSLRPWWNRNGENSIENELDEAFVNYSAINDRCKSFDIEMHESGKKHGGETYAKLLDLGYRQSISAHKLVESPEGEILFLSKENFSNGSINTVDVTYPSAPLFLIYNPDLLKGMMNGIFYYSESGKWTKPFPAHDLGTYPIATGQTYEEDMPVEEAGNMLILTAAIVKAEGDASYALKHWESLKTWAKFLTEEGFDPEEQLCTDDFAGHLARNSNLSIKAIIGIGAFGYLAGELGYKDMAEEYTLIAGSMANMWEVLADSGDHYALTFNDKDTWSQKYNLVWDKLLDLRIFPDKVYEKELEFYKNKHNKYGLPLDSRSDYTKSDWILWTATLAESIEEFKKYIEPVYLFAIETEDRVPLTDWHYTSKGKMEGFQARSVVGGFFIKSLKEEWKKERFLRKLEEETISK
jgi:hypothetical protein